MVSLSDLRFVLLLIMNILISSHAGMSSKWDPFDVIYHLTWFKFWLLLLLLFIFSSVSIEIPILNTTTSPDHYLLMTCFLASLLVPQSHIWWAYLTILYRAPICTMLRSFLFWAKVFFSTFPGVNMLLTLNHDRELHGGGGGGVERERDIEQGGGISSF